MPTETLPRVFEIKQGHVDFYACKLMPVLIITEDKYGFICRYYEFAV